MYLFGDTPVPSTCKSPVDCGHLDIGISEVRHPQLREEISTIQVECVFFEVNAKLPPKVGKLRGT